MQLDDVEEYIAEASRQYNGAGCVFDPWQSAGLMQRLLVRGVRSEEHVFSAGSVGRPASTLLVLLRNHAVALPDDSELVDELANLRLKETAPGVLRIDRDPDKHDDRAIALGAGRSENRELRVAAAREA